MSRSAAPPESKARWEHFPHDADVGVQGWWKSLSQIKAPKVGRVHIFDTWLLKIEAR